MPSRHIHGMTTPASLADDRRALAVLENRWTDLHRDYTTLPQDSDEWREAAQSLARNELDQSELRKRIGGK